MDLTLKFALVLINISFLLVIIAGQEGHEYSRLILNSDGSSSNEQTVKEFEDVSESSSIIDESSPADKGSHKGSINGLKLNEKVEIDDKNPTLQELKKKIEDKLKEKETAMKEEEKKKEDDRVVNLKPKKGGEECKGSGDGEKESKKDDDKKDKEKER